ncbi:probable rRNA maturation factor [Desulfacinum hydrothermale DSM 13146]|uniref:Endoribonuclease YbeY n=1 Tax=Desulfacinum hydrothermale DSM 13146 TaxID=1121390 RepID=A0A1W1X1L2_9BACT|nr:rRNA maturation RNase YbeY [Desulfacinum hydrothermale]SMC17856.1 probable rRNA maturation factor [Desulfacinum hydrothermale DSM 13146]
MEQAAERILNALGCNEAELSLAVLDDEAIRKLNAQYRGVDEPTDVLSFPMGQGEFADIAPQMLGDVVLSVETADAMAAAHRISLEAVLDLLLIHGVLHLVGYDHADPQEARRMDRKTLDLLTLLGHDPKDFAWYETSAPYAKRKEEED